ncbi:hypothetical protein LTR78_008967 [Recurvomyces mirabilis]|uniref:DUF7907 domain-containing protein n=1 Tax=Recurvomyces mirabilis TaxID=574656 RepID=A0AAE0WFJ3_9PEZI|nr:hypothetical protein LTR78_008967 [Recurvomyces mirabilis]KAK5159768.1 hypothetical protein LTS14_001873 [Recurvomyces mirabilis]
MKVTLFSIASGLLLCGAKAQDYLDQSPAFSLELLSDDTDLNGAFLSACHVGAALEQLCILGGDSTSLLDAEVFSFNTSSSDDGQQAENPGLVTFSLPYTGSNGSATVSEPLGIFPNIGDILATVELTPGGIDGSNGGSVLAFDDDELLNVPWSTAATDRPAFLYSWYICNATLTFYPTLYWVVGSGAPNDPTCCPVNVTRVWNN